MGVVRLRRSAAAKNYALLFLALERGDSPIPPPRRLLSCGARRRRRIEIWCFAYVGHSVTLFVRGASPVRLRLAKIVPYP